MSTTKKVTAEYEILPWWRFRVVVRCPYCGSVVYEVVEDAEETYYYAEREVEYECDNCGKKFIAYFPTP